MDFLWTKDINLPHFPSFDGDISTDVLVIGGGMAGVLCAMMLSDAGVDSILLEAKQIGRGITMGTTAVLSAQHDTPYSTLIKKFGEDKARGYLKANLRAVEKFRSLSRTIDCDFEDKPSLMYTRGDVTTLRREARAVRALGFQAEFIAKPNLPFETQGAVKYPGMGQFHPLKFLAGAAQGLTIFENTFVERLEGTVAFTKSGRITAKKVIVATHFPFINRWGLYFAKLYQKRSFVLALENAPELDCTAVSTAPDNMYFRNYNNLLLVGGGDHRTGKKGGGFDAVRAFVRQWFPYATEKYTWATQDCMSLDGVPYIGRYSLAAPNVFVATGFNEWGMTSSMAAASILTDMAMGRENRYSAVFSPDRSMLRPQLFLNLGTTIINLATPTAKRCSHMGCALKWNSAEHTWDCPCHGSRFEENGHLIDNPAMKNIPPPHHPPR